MEDEFHTPVLLEEVCGALAPALPNAAQAPAGVLVDATCGGGGHAVALLERTRPAVAVLIDRDRQALARAAARVGAAAPRLRLAHAPFSRIRDVLAEEGIERVAAILADLGVSTHQLQTAERGFSIRHDAPLDMRMDQSRGPTAADILAELDAPGLTRILRELGEEPDASRIAKAIVSARPRTTGELARLVEQAMSAPQRRRLGRRIHPATRTFQAIRIHVNRELEELDALLEAGPNLLEVGGRIAIITFHSLEDRRVKRAFAARSRPPSAPAKLPIRDDDLAPPLFRIPHAYRRGVVPSVGEIDRNPRARSARLRVLERCTA